MVSGNSQNILNGDTTPSSLDFTDFGSTVLNTAITRQFILSNNGDSDLEINNIALSNIVDYTIVGTPFTGIIAPSSSETIIVQFNSTIQGIYNTNVTINSNDLDNSIFSFGLRGSAYPDFDSDGIDDNQDLDDDNDGILEQP